MISQASKSLQFLIHINFLDSPVWKSFSDIGTVPGGFSPLNIMLAPPTHANPTRIRWVILFLLFGISVITYIDRVNISVTARHMMPALGMTDIQMGWVFSAFVLGYALCQIPGGWLGDRWGARRILTLAVIWWSIFTAVTALAPTLPIVGMVGILGSLMLVRFLIGVGEAAALPNFNRAEIGRAHV